MDDFSQMTEDVKFIIEEMINNRKELPSYISVGQLKMIVDELDKMNRIRNMNLFVPYYPKCIVDSWDFDDGLGKKLLKVLDFYGKF